VACYGGCHGYSKGCHGCYGCSGYSSCHGCHGLFSCFKRHGCHGCYSACYGTSYQCHGCYGCYGCYGCGGAMMAAPPANLPPAGAPVGAPAKPATPPAGGAPKVEGKEEATVPAPARLLVTVPAEAKLTIDDVATKSTGTTRVFATPELNPGKDYVYTLKAEITVGSKTETIVKQVTVRAGVTTEASLELPVVTASK
jgi:uncharacterized protein (TIGR03000 family)